MNFAINAHNLHKSYGKTTALNGVSLKVPEGQCMALLGPNGAGKTTCVEILEGILPSDQGHVHILGKPLLPSAHRQIMENVGVMLQETRFYGKFTVRETLELFQSFYQTKADISNIIAQLYLKDKEHARLEHLSGGQRQRAYLGCALVNSPALLFLDEPTTGLDPQSRRMIWDLLQEQKRRKTSILLTTHYMEEAQQLADNVAIINNGVVIAQGSPDQLIQEYCPFELLSFSLKPSQTAMMEQLAAKLPWLKEAVRLGDSYKSTTPSAATYVQQLMQAAQTISCDIEKIEVRKASLEDVFLQLTGRDITDA